MLLLFGPRNPLTNNGGIAVNLGFIGEGFKPRSPLTGFGGMVINPEEALVILL